MNEIRRWLDPLCRHASLAALLGLLTVATLATAQPAINVNNVENLYAEVNNPANVDTVIVLASGNYVLTPADPSGSPRPNGGRLVLEAGMALIGQNEYVDSDGDGIWDPRDDNHDGVLDSDGARGLVFALPASETIIDASKLVWGGQGAVRMGLANRVERLTVRETGGVGAAIDVNALPPSGGMRAEIRDNIVEDGQRGIRLQHSGIHDIDSSAVLERNIVRRHTGTFGFALQIMQGRSTNCSWDVSARNNLFYANRFGMFVAGNGSTNVQGRILSMENVYRENQAGINLFAGLDTLNIGGQPEGGNGNNVHLTSIRDGIFDNVEIDNTGGWGGGVVAMAGVSSDPNANPSSNNDVSLEFIGTSWLRNFEGTTPRDLLVYGAAAIGGTPGTNDTVSLLIRKGTSDGTANAFLVANSAPEDLTHTDQVTIAGSNVALTRTNVGISLPEGFSSLVPAFEDDSN